jgi:hypothetical protein
VAVGILETLRIGGCLSRNKLLRESCFLYELDLKPGRSHNIHSETACPRFRYSPLQNALAGGTVEGWFDEGILFLECVNQSDDLLVAQ